MGIMYEDRIEAERWIESAITVLECIQHGDLQLREVASAVESYRSGSCRTAAVAARAVVKPSKKRGFPHPAIPQPKSLEELKGLFRDVRIKTRLISSSIKGAKGSPARDSNSRSKM